jgi:DNA-binding winged helix-turn-helix (wHTH) protein/tetratricopeptide (TPR) repeat protein
MAANIYRFRNFKLDTQARELYRDGALIALPVSTLDCLVYLIHNRHRTVGRDELMAAVWERVDTSEVSLNHAIMRLRRVLSDSGNDQNSIRTLPRLGYRWIVEPTVVEEIVPPVAGFAQDESAPVAFRPASVQAAVEGGATADAATGRRGKSRLLAFALLLVVLSLVAIPAILAWRHSHQPSGTDIAGKQRPAMVLPAQVDAAGEWDWLRLGFMDLVANRLRKGELATTPSETVVGLVNAHQLDVGSGFHVDPSLAAKPMLLIQPYATLANGLWNVRLEARGDGRNLISEAQAKDVLAAGRAAADDLLVKLGHMPSTAAEADPSLVAEELARRVNAAVLAGQLQVANTLIKNAPIDAQSSPEVALSTAAIEFFSGDYEASRMHAEALLDRLPADKNPQLRARVLNRLGATYFRQSRNDDADKAFVEVIHLLEFRNDPDIVATAYAGRGVVAGQAQRLDEAVAYFGRSRTLHEMSNDAFGVARVDLNLGAIAMDRGQPAAAAPIFREAAERFESLATPEALNSALRSLADAQSMLLEHEPSLATTERFWPAETHSRNARERWWLTLSRAVALAGTGRLHDADDLIKRILDSSDPVEDEAVRTEAVGLTADLALLRGDNARAAELAAKALTPTLENTNWQDYEGTWFTRVRGLQRSGQLATAADEIKRLRSWADAAPGDRRLLYVVLVEADQANAEGHGELALQRYASALALAERLGIPDDIVNVGGPYVEALLVAGRVDEASAMSGRLAQWADKDMRAVWSQAQVYQALGKSDAARDARDRARQLAGERILLGDSAAQSH